jgi:hypothetical protein
VLAKTGYVMLGAWALTRRRVQLMGWRGRVMMGVVALSLASLSGLELRYGVGLRWGRHEIHVGKQDVAVPTPSSTPRQLGVTASGDLLWLHPSP